MATADLGVRIVLQDGARAGFDALGLSIGRVGGLGGALTQMWGMLDPATQALGVVAAGAAFVFAGFAGAIGYVVSQGAQLQDSMANIEIAVDGANTHMQGLQDTLLSVADNSIYSTQQVAEAFVALGQHGQDAEAIMNGVGQAAIYLAEATRSQTVPAASLLGQTLQIFGYDASQATTVANDLTFAFEHGIPSVQDLSSAMAQAGPAAAAMHIPLADLVPVLDILAQKMGSGTKAGTALAYMLNAVSDPTSKATNELAQLGVIVVNQTAPAISQLTAKLNASGGASAKAAQQYDGSVGGLDNMFKAAQKIGAVPTTETFMQWAASTGALNDKLYDSNGKFLGLDNMLNVIMGTIAKLDPQQQALAIQQLFNVRSGKGAMDMVAAWEKGKITLANYQQELAKYSAETNAETKTNTLSGAMNQLKTNFSSFAALVGQTDLGPLQGFAKAISGILAKMEGSGSLTKFGADILNIGVVASGAIGGVAGLGFSFGAIKKFSESDAAKQIGQGFRDIFGSWGTTVFGPLKEGQHYASGFMGGLHKLSQAASQAAGGGTWSGLWGSIQKGQGALVDFNKGWLGMVGNITKTNWIEKLDNGIKGLATGGFGMLKTAVVSGIPSMLSFAAAAAPIILIVLLVAGAIAVGILLFTKFKTQGQEIANVLKSVFGPIVKSVFNDFHKVVGQIQAQWKQVQPQLTKAMNGLVGAFKQAAPAFQFVGNVIGAVLHIIINVLGGVVKGFIAALPAITNVFTGIFTVIGKVTQLIQAIFDGQWGKIPGLIGGIFTAILSIVKNALSAMLTFAGNIVAGIFNGLKAGLTQIGGFPLQVFNAIVGGIKSLFGIHSPSSVMTQHGTSIVQGLINGAINLIGTVAGIPGKIASALINGLASLPGTLLQKGADIMNGLINGLKSKLGDLGGMVKNIGGSILGGLGNLFHFGSPSKVTSQMGTWVSQGMLEGIKSIDVAGGAASHYGKITAAVAKAIAPTPGMAAAKVASSTAMSSAQAAGAQGGDLTIPLQVSGKTIAQVTIDRLTGQLKQNGVGRKMHAMKG